MYITSSVINEAKRNEEKIKSKTHFVAESSAVAWSPSWIYSLRK